MYLFNVFFDKNVGGVNFNCRNPFLTQFSQGKLNYWTRKENYPFAGY